MCFTYRKGSGSAKIYLDHLTRRALTEPGSSFFWSDQEESMADPCIFQKRTSPHTIEEGYTLVYEWQDIRVIFSLACCQDVKVFIEQCLLNTRGIFQLIEQVVHLHKENGETALKAFIDSMFEQD